MRLTSLIVAALMGACAGSSPVAAPAVAADASIDTGEVAAASNCTSGTECVTVAAGGAARRLACIGGACAPCRSTPDCADHGAGFTCTDGRCMTGCGGAAGCLCSDGPCATGLTCQGTVCAPDGCAATPGAKDCPCAAPGDCDAGLICLFGSCGTCLGAGCECATHDECAPDEGCFSEKCATCPHGSPGCPCEGGACETGTCNALVDLCIAECADGTQGCPCALSGACDGGLWCDGTTCRSCSSQPGRVGCPCLDAGVCAEGAACDEAGQCVVCASGQVGCPCGAGFACDSGARCDALANRCVLCDGGPSCPCKVNADCKTGHRCSAQGLCEFCAAGGPCGCATSSDCPGCDVCVDGTCLSVATAPGKLGCACGAPNLSCEAGTECQAGLCKAPCVPGTLGCTCDGAACVDGSVCTGGTCVACSPACTGKVCGPDGCGGSCGVCPNGAPCAEGSCTAGPLGQLTVEVGLPAISDVAGVQFVLGYDTGLLSAGPSVEVLPGLLDSMHAVNTDLAGQVIFAGVPSPAVNGPMPVLRVTFSKKAAATLSALTLLSQEVVDSTYATIATPLTLSLVTP